MVPDTFKDGSPVVLEGRYSADERGFVAEAIMAKCPSKYEGQDYNNHTATRGSSG
jgi:cytochrome c-type biogenesis protein CcmE